uniref:thiamine diphosphokinase n=1 Tax=Eubacterium cellulosolvens TaxID=29322 RepID=UPI00047FC891|nr:thiamine diphosphokinase [[Eubacterium] cellulosolvens]
MKRAIVLSGGNIDRSTAMRLLEIEKPDLVIAADRGLAFCDACGIRPDAIVGDFDSLEHAQTLVERYRAMGIPIEEYRPEKDMTDTDIALEKAVAAGATDIFFLGATGTRLDHTLSNIFNLYKLRQRGITGVIVDANNRITMPCGKKIQMKRSEQYGRYLSFFAFNGAVTGLTLRGLKYPLDHAVLRPADGGLAVSNEFAEETAEITYEDGVLIIMETRD